MTDDRREEAISDDGRMREFAYPDAPWWTFVLYGVAVAVMVLGVFLVQ